MTLSQKESGAWLWCSKDDFMIDAIRKVQTHCHDRIRHLPLLLLTDCVIPSVCCVACLQMAKGNVGSLLVFDPAKIDFASNDKVKSAAGDAVVGIVTERGDCIKQVDIDAVLPAWRVSGFALPALGFLRDAK